MTIKTSNTVLKVTGILSIIGGIISIIVSLIALVGGGLLGVAVDGSLGALIILAGLLALVGSVIELLTGIFSVKAANDNSKIQPAWTFAVVTLAFAVINLIITIVQHGGIFSNIISIALAVLVFVAANTIKNATPEVAATETTAE